MSAESPYFEPVDDAESDEGSAVGPIAADEDHSALRPGIMAILFLSLPLFGQIFHYMKDLLPLWSLSKAFPILSLPLALVVFRHPGVPMTRQVLISFLWLTLVPSFAGIFTFNQDFFTGLAAQVKLLPMLYFFSFFGLLLLLRPSLRELMAGFVICGIITFIILVILWLVVPQSAYGGHYAFGSSPLFTSDNRGNRIRMPMYFAIIAIFYFYRRFLRAPRLAPLVWALVGVGLTMGLVKTRAMLVGIAGVMLINGFLSSRRWLRMVMMVGAPLAVAAMFSFSYLGSVFRTDPSSGFDVRWQTVLKATSFLGVDPIRWIVGVGTISPTSTDSLSAYFDHFFFLADITWLGVIFEFGLLGALLFLAYELRGIAFYHRSLKSRIDSDFLGSLGDYLIYVLLISNLYPPTLTPGETAVILAIFAYVWQWLQTQDEQSEEL